MEKIMRRISLIVLACVTMAWQPAGAVTISASQDLGAVPANPGTGLLGSYYKFSSSSNIGSLANANILESSSGGPTATFTTTEVCFPDCAGTSISDSNMMTTFLNGHASNFSYTSASQPTSIDHSAITLTGYISITQTGTYNFNLGSDDGSALTIGGQTVVNNDSDHGFTTVGGSATFTQAGLYAISIQYFEDSGSTGLDFFAKDPNGTCIIGLASNCAAGSASTGLLYSSLPTTATPEPASILMFGAGLGGLAWVRRRSRRAV
jgi:PA14 domain/PEP-CTERM motif